MESRHRSLLLSAFLSLASLPVTALAAEPLATLEEGSIEPRISRLDTEELSVPVRSLEAGVWLGQIATEDFGTNLSYGVSLLWHGSEDSFYQLDLGRAGLQRTSAERLGTEADLNIDDGHDLSHIHLSSGWNVVPGEFRWRGRSLPVSGYLLAGGGQTQILGNNEFSFCLGTGLRVILSDTMLLHLDARQYMYESDVLVTKRTYHDLELRAGLSTLF
jgi:outer membrane beta-barrel protein